MRRLTEPDILGAAALVPYLLSVLAAISVMAPANNMHIHYWIIAYVLLIASLARLTALARRQTPASAPSVA